MKLGHWMTAKDVLRVNAFKWPNKVGAKDLYKARTFKEWDERSCRLANTLSGLGMKKGDRLHAGKTATEKEISDHCRGKIAGYKIPRKIIFIKDEEMPRSGAGKILHRILRDQYGHWKDTM